MYVAVLYILVKTQSRLAAKMRRSAKTASLVINFASFVLKMASAMYAETL
jgi:hypothetical protein